MATDSTPKISTSEIEAALRQEQRRKEYNLRPEVIEKRQAYQKKQQERRRAINAAQKGDIAKLTSELGYSKEDAATLITAVQKVKL